jgi:hypothetical protein
MGNRLIIFYPGSCSRCRKSNSLAYWHVHGVGWVDLASIMGSNSYR